MFTMFSKKINKKRKGFTLIELVVVIAILGILAAIAIPRFMSQTENARHSAREATARTLNSAAAMYMADEEASDTVAGTGNELSAALSAADAYASLVAADLIQVLDAEMIAVLHTTDNQAATAGFITYEATTKLFTYTE